MLNGLRSDVAYAARSLAKAPAFTFVCIVSLGIGMAPVIAVPYVARIPVIPPPGVNTEGLVEVIASANKSRGVANSWSYPDFVDLRNADTGMTIFAWVTAPTEVKLPGGIKTALWPMYVSGDYFRTLGVPLARGPGFEGQTGAFAILSFQFWKNRLGSDPGIVGKTIRLNNVPYVVAGIAPDQFQGHLGLQGRELFVPLERHPDLLDSRTRFDRGKEWLHIHGRLSPGVNAEQARATVARITARLAKEYPATNEFRAGSVAAFDPLGVEDRSQFRVIKTMALTLTGALLLVVCLNISGMMQVRGAMRERELSIRQAVGASRLRLAGHLLAEAVLLGAAGAALASLLLFNAPAVVSRLSGQEIPAAVQDALRFDVSMAAICMGICLLTSLAFGLLPAVRFSRPAIISSLKDDAGAGGLRVGRVHRITAALQVAIAVPLLVLGGISLDRVRSTATADLGFDSDLLYAAPLEIDAGPGDRTAGDIDFRIRKLRDKFATAGGVTSVTVADGLPLDFRGRVTPVSAQADVNAAPAIVRSQVTRVGSGYLHTMGIPLLGGRDFSDGDRAGSEKVTIVTRPLAERLFPGTGAAETIGKRITFGAAAGDMRPETLTVIGVAGDFPTAQMDSERAQLLLPLAQQRNTGSNSIVTDEDGNRLPDLLMIARRAAGEQPGRITAALESAVREVDPDFRRDRIVTGVSLRRKRMDNFLKQSAIAGAAGGVILMLSALGIYGVVGLTVATRTREIAVRAALGASRGRVLGMILFDVVKLATPGIGAGLVLAAAFIRVKGESMGIPLSSVETLAYLAGAAIAMIVAVIASLGPARRAASVLPMVAMRSE